jgi:hypothetical protein
VKSIYGEIGPLDYLEHAKYWKNFPNWKLNDIAFDDLDPNMDNACFRDNSNTTHCLPSWAYGCCPKAGTSALFNYFIQHPDAEAFHKEINFANKNVDQKKGLVQWTQEFPALTNPHGIVADGTPRTINALYKLVPFMKMIYMWRCPASQQWSTINWVNTERNVGGHIFVPHPVPAHIQKGTKRKSRVISPHLHYKEFLDKQSKGYKQWHVNKHYKWDEARQSCGRADDVSYFVEHEREFPGRVLFLKNELMHTETQAVMDIVFNFLGMRPYVIPDAGFRGKDDVLTKPYALLPETRALMMNEYERCILRMGELMGGDMISDYWDGVMSADEELARRPFALLEPDECVKCDPAWQL